MRSTNLPGQTQLRIIWAALTALAVAAIAVVTVGLIWGIGKFLNLLSPVLWPLAIAAVLAYLLDPPVNWLERRGISRTWAITIAFAGLLAIFGGVLSDIIPQIIDETNNLISKIPAYTNRVQQRLNDWAYRAERVAVTASQQSQGTNAPAATNAPPGRTNPQTSSSSRTNAPSAEMSNVHQIHNQIIASATNWTGTLFSKIGSWLLSQLAKATAFIDVVIALVLIPIYSFYFLRQKAWIQRHWSDYLPVRNSRVKRETVFILTSINQYMIAFFRGQVLVAICSSILYTIGFLSIGLDYSFLLGFFCLIFTMVPFLGSLINFIVALVLTTMQFGDWFHPLMIVVVFSVVIGLENFFYSPLIMGNRVHLHPLIVIVAVMIGITVLGGILGGVLAIPLAAALRVILFRYLWKKPIEALPEDV